MAIRAILGFDELALRTGEMYGAATKYAFAGLPMSFNFGTAAGAGVSFLKEAGWVKTITNPATANNTSGKRNFISAPLTALGLVTSAASVITIGIRWLIPQDVTVSSMWPQPISLTADLSTGGAGANVTAGAVFPFGSIPNWKPGIENYLEAQFDVTAGVIRRRVDGLPIADLSMVTLVKNLLTSNTAFFAGGVGYTPTSGATVAYDFWFKDMYVIEKTDDGSADTFLGPQRIVPINVTTLDQASWLPTPSGDPVAALNTAITDEASLLTPVVMTDPNNVTANLGLTMSSTAGQINGIVLNATGKKAGGSPGVLTSQVITGTDQSSQVVNNLLSVITPSFKLYQGEKSPSGARWTRASIQAAKLKLIAG